MIKVDELKLVEVITRMMSEAAYEAFMKEKVTLNDTVMKFCLREIVQENLLELNGKDCDKLWDVINFCFDAD